MGALHRDPGDLGLRRCANRSSRSHPVAGTPPTPTSTAGKEERDPLVGGRRDRGGDPVEGPATVAAVILEPVQNGGGCFVPQDGYFERVREICESPWGCCDL